MNLPSLRDNPVFYLGLLVTVEQGIAGGTIHLTNAVPEAWIPYITAWAALLGFIGTTIMTALSAPGVLKPATAAKVGAILLAMMVLAPGEARAQENRLTPDFSSVPIVGVNPIETISTKYIPMIAMSSPGHEVFRLEPGGCLRGPLSIHAENGQELFRLAADATYPTDCMGASK